MFNEFIEVLQHKPVKKSIRKSFESSKNKYKYLIKTMA